MIDGTVILEYLVNIIIAGGILIVGIWLSGKAAAYVTEQAAASPQIDATLGRFFGSLTRYAVLAIVVIAVLDRFGVETTSLVALLGAAGLAVGLALQGTLSHLAAGVMLILFRPLKVGDYVDVAGHSGTVREVGLFMTELATVDNVQIVVPNGDIWDGPIVNYSAHSDRRVDLVFGVSYDSDLKRAEEVLQAVIEADARIKHSPAEPFVAVTNLGDSSVDFTIRVWCDTSDYWALKFHLMRDVKERFDAAGVAIPFPTTTIVNSAA
ncbi:MAG: mechanosensitive ion channel [Rhodobacteraceae bacterium]|nr:mechanosensitive ion channel [Paracoccaceae bacterium]